MVATQAKLSCGMGLYTPAEAALYAKLRTATFNRWFFGNNRGSAALNPRIQQNHGERVVTFWDLIQAVGVKRLRTGPEGSRITLDHIRAVVERCQERGLNYPLAQNHKLFWFSNRLILRTDRTAEGEYIGLIPGTDLHQLYANELIEPYLEEVCFGDDGMAETWTPLEHKGYEVVLSSKLRFGLPIIKPGCILVSALVDAVDAEGSIEAAAEAFETEAGAVRLALKYNEYLSSAA